MFQEAEEIQTQNCGSRDLSPSLKTWISALRFSFENLVLGHGRQRYFFGLEPQSWS